MENLDVSPRFDAYSKVIIHVDEETTYVAGTDTGRVLEIDNPFGTQAMANQLLQRLSGFQYQPYEATGALLDPTAEIGDALSTTTTYGGIYRRDRKFGRLMKADVAASEDEEIDHEFQYDTPEHREFIRATENLKEYTRASFTVAQNAITAEVERATASEGELRATFNIRADEITAEVNTKVAANGGNNTSGSFSWSLTSSGHRWYANGSNTPVFSITKDGAYVNGEIRATKGTIGGFTIGDNAIYKNISEYGGTQSTGVYIGTNGIQLGQRFKVDSSGNMEASNITATSMRLKGTLTFLNDDGTSAGTMTAANLRQGAAYANAGHSNWDAAHVSTSSGGYCYGGAGGGYAAMNVFSGNQTAAVLGCSRFYLGGSAVGRTSISFVDGNGRTRTMYYLGWG